MMFGMGKKDEDENEHLSPEEDDGQEAALKATEVLQEMLAKLDPDLLTEEQTDTLSQQVAVGLAMVSEVYGNACNLFMQAHVEDLTGDVPTDPLVLEHRARAIKQAEDTGVEYQELINTLDAVITGEESGIGTDTLHVGSAAELVATHVAIHNFLASGLKGARKTEVAALTAMYAAPAAGE
jgi:hypothetical protein